MKDPIDYQLEGQRVAIVTAARKVCNAIEHAEPVKNEDLDRYVAARQRAAALASLKAAVARFGDRAAEVVAKGAMGPPPHILEAKTLAEAAAATEGN